MKKYAFLLLILLAGCATNPDKMTSSYVSPIQYQHYTCKQIIVESSRIERKISELYSALKKDASNDAIQMGVGLVLFWPTLFFLEGGDDARAVEYQRLKGEYEALEKISIQKQCGYEFKFRTDTVNNAAGDDSNRKSGDFGNLN